MRATRWIALALVSLPAAAETAAPPPSPVCGTEAIEAALKRIDATLERQARASELASTLGRMQVAVQELDLLRQELRISRSEAERGQADFEDAQYEYTDQLERASAANPGLPKVVTEDTLLHLHYRMEVARNRLPGLQARLTSAEEAVEAKQAEVDEWRRTFDQLFGHTGH